MRNISLLTNNFFWDASSNAFKWKHSSNGLFSVKTAYHLIKKTDIQAKGGPVEQSDKTEIHKFWKKLWVAKVPNKVKNFWWRLYYNSLPDARNLLRRGIDLESRCRVCGWRIETALHVIIDCWWARALLNGLGLIMPPSFFEIDDPADWIWICALNMSGGDFRIAMMASLLAWKNRNRIWHEQGSWSIEQATIIGKTYTLGATKVIFETDSLEVFNAVVMGAGVEDWCASWIGGVMDFLQKMPEWSVAVVPRICNVVADGLARNAR
ncbi:hypothetical protein QQ045_017278 [Rhodiola kirilowii]